MDPHTTELASGLYEVQIRLTQIAQAAMPTGLIADEVCSRVRTGYKFTHTMLSEEDLLSIPDVRASRAGHLNQVEFGATDTTASVVDYGLEDSISSRDIEEAQAQEVAFDPLEQAAISTAELVKLARGRRVAELVTGADSYADGHSVTLAGNAQWSHANANLRKAILEALDVPLVRPNVLVLGRKVWTALRQHPKIVEAVSASGAGDEASGSVMKEAVAELFEVDRVLVAWPGIRARSAARRTPSPASGAATRAPSMCAATWSPPATRCPSSAGPPMPSAGRRSAPTRSRRAASTGAPPWSR